MSGFRFAIRSLYRDLKAGEATLQEILPALFQEEIAPLDLRLTELTQELELDPGESVFKTWVASNEKERWRRPAPPPPF